MNSFWGTRLIYFVATLALSIVFSFLLLHLTPGDPVDLLLGPQAPETQKEAYRQLLRLDQPVFDQFRQYVSGLMTGNLGTSLSFQRPVLELIRERFPKTAQLALVGLVLTALFGFGLGLFSAWLARFRLLNLALLGLSVVGQSTPNFLLGPILIFALAITLPLFPVSGSGSLAHLALPALTLSLSLFAIVSRMTYVGLATEMQHEYIRVVQAKGASRLRALVRHALRNVSIPLVNLLALQLGALLTGAVVTETIFQWPGVGSLLFSAIEKRDYPLIQGLVLMFTITFAIINFLADIASCFLDPRLRSATDDKH